MVSRMISAACRASLSSASEGFQAALIGTAVLGLVATVVAAVALRHRGGAPSPPIGDQLAAEAEG
jgi:hypothetical protein